MELTLPLHLRQTFHHPLLHHLTFPPQSLRSFSIPTIQLLLLIRVDAPSFFLLSASFLQDPAPKIPPRPLPNLLLRLSPHQHPEPPKLTTLPHTLLFLSQPLPSPIPSSDLLLAHAAWFS